MIKKMAMVLFCTVLGTTAHAEISTSETFIGIELASTEVQGEQPISTSDGVSYGVRIGAQNEEWRTIIGLNHYDKDEYAVEKLYLSVDYLIMNYDAFEEFTIEPYVGVKFGYANYEQGPKDESGMIYGAQLGLIVNVMERFDVDLGYRYVLSSADAFDHESDFLLGLHYHF
ncbi:MAG: porin family protein [Sulfurovum sp.]|nr:porin family protein [Sulfurovum sp.]